MYMECCILKETRSDKMTPLHFSVVNSTLANNDNSLIKDSYNLSAEQMHTVLLIFVALLAVSALGLVSGSGHSLNIPFLIAFNSEENHCVQPGGQIFS